MSEIYIASMGGEAKPIGWYWVQRGDQDRPLYRNTVIAREWTPDNPYRKGFYWYTWRRDAITEL